MPQSTNEQHERLAELWRGLEEAAKAHDDEAIDRILTEIHAIIDTW